MSDEKLRPRPFLADTIKHLFAKSFVSSRPLAPTIVGTHRQSMTRCLSKTDIPRNSVSEDFTREMLLDFLKDLIAECRPTVHHGWQNAEQFKRRIHTFAYKLHRF